MENKWKCCKNCEFFRAGVNFYTEYNGKCSKGTEITDAMETRCDEFKLRDLGSEIMDIEVTVKGNQEIIEKELNEKLTEILEKNDITHPLALDEAREVFVGVEKDKYDM